MNPYFLFSWMEPEPQAGWRDFKGAFASEADAWQYFLELRKTQGAISYDDAYQIIDSRTLQIIREGRL